MNKERWKANFRRTISVLLTCMILATTLSTPVMAVHTYYWPDAISQDAMDIKAWTWSAEGETAAMREDAGLTPTGLSQQETALMGGYTSKFWFQNEHAKTITVPGTGEELDFSKFHHRYFACADSHNTGWFAPVGAQIAFKQMYYPTEKQDDYPLFLQNAPMDMETRKFALLLISMISAAYETPSREDLRDSDRTSMYYYLLWASIWSNDKYVDQGVFTGESPEKDWDFVQYFVCTMLKSLLDPDPYGSTAIYDAFRDGGPAWNYFNNCWKAAKFLSAFDYTVVMGSTLPISKPTLGDDGMYHMTFLYGGLSDYEREVYRRLEADNLAGGWEYLNDGSVIDFKSADGTTDGNPIATLKLQESSEEDHFYNCGFGVGGLAGFQGCAKAKETQKQKWGNTQVYFSAVSEPLELLVIGQGVPFGGDWNIEVHRYEHTETWETHYNIQLRKYDSETGQPLAGSKWDILEAFDASQLDATELKSPDNWANRSGSQFKKWDGWDFGDGNPSGEAADDPCSWDINVTNDDGLLMLGDNEEHASGQKAHTDTKSYTYTKGYCGGHPKPQTEESGDPEVDAENEAAAQEAWQKEVDACERLAAVGGFYHAVDPGEAKAQMEADRDKCYKHFLSLTYDYSAVELNPRPGYTVHGAHTDDIPIEVKKVTSSEFKDGAHGRNLSYATANESTLKRMDMLRPVSEKGVKDEKTPKGSEKKGLATPSDPDPFDAAPFHASPSDATSSNASPSNSKMMAGATERLKGLFEEPKSLVVRSKERSLLSDDEDMAGGDFELSEVAPISPGDGSMIDHTFIVYDHRTEGEIHINKRDLYLKNGEKEGYGAYGYAMGDGTLEGAVYGLFALQDIGHPDGHTGTVYQKDDLVAIAATDRNGDASFMAFTEAPGRTWDYQSGQIERRPGAFAEPQNLYRERGAAGTVPDIESYIGHDSDGDSINLIDTRPGEKKGYWKNSSNQSGIEGLSGNHVSYPLSDNETENGNCWIGRPLIVEENGTAYYVKELSRSEGYELSVNGKTNLVTNGQDNYENEYRTADVETGRITLNMVKNGNYFDVTAHKPDHDITLQGIGFPGSAAFGISTTDKVSKKIAVPIYSTVTKPVMATAGAFVYRDGKMVQKAVGETVTFPGGQSYSVNEVSAGADQTIGVKPMNFHTLGTPNVTDLHSEGSIEVFRNAYNAELDNIGYREPGTDTPWVRIMLNGTGDASWLASVTAGIRNCDLQYFNCLRIAGMEQSGGRIYAILRYEWRLYGDERDDSVYVPNRDRLYQKKDSGNGYFVYAPYDDVNSNSSVISCRMKNGFLERATIKDQTVNGLTVKYPEGLPAQLTLETVRTPAYWIYTAGEQEISDFGELKYTEETKVDYIEQKGIQEVEKITSLTADYDPETKTYTVILPASAFESQDTVSLKVDDDGTGDYSIKQAYYNQSYFTVLPLDQGEDSYVVPVTLTRPPARQPWQDGNTRVKRAGVLERPIMQKVKIVKDISVDENGQYSDNTYAGAGHEDGFTQSGGGNQNNTVYRPNFRFKAYLKSNLRQLYRAQDGTVVWQDRNGNAVDPSVYQDKFPETVQKLYTMALHQTISLKRNSNDTVIAYPELYSSTNGLINENQNPGYSAVLERALETVKGPEEADQTVGLLNYKKFFSAIRAANQDKWDNAEGIRKNAESSDQVRQFAIDWYLDEEVKKLVKENETGEMEGAAGGEHYQDEIYDTALFNALSKTENYLKPFFTYDLDKIYAIEWEKNAAGGIDKDRFTLSADKEDAESGYYYGVSGYLPYGTYVMVEQQPSKKELFDGYNKHYRIDAPKEIELPAVYEGGMAGLDRTPEQLSSYYQYDIRMHVSELTAKYKIRFNEEWPGETGEDLRNYVIQAHGNYGDYEIYKYGLDLDHLSEKSGEDPIQTGYYEITQGKNDPVKDYYNTIADLEEDGGNPDSHYLADDRNYGKTTPNGKEYEKDAIERIYRYGSLSEEKQMHDEVSLEGMQSAYHGRYAPMLVPWSITEPDDEMTDLIPQTDGESGYQGFGYRKFRNTFYTSRLRIEKTDSETGENILHDGAVFALYAAVREDGRNTDELVHFYEKDTMIKGSEEFLNAMGADRITPAARAIPGVGGLWTGTVPAGTPICSEAQQIIMTDEKGLRTGKFEAFTTTRDGRQAKENDGTAFSWQNQNTGYLVTPQPLGAGTYVLCEMRPPAGYVRTKPIAIEVYSDKITYYLEGNREKRVTAAIYEEERRILPQRMEDTARIYAGNTPIRFELSKIKEKDQSVIYKTNTRVEGTETELKAEYGRENLEYAYKNGTYLGYAWYKGTLEYLESRKNAGEAVEPVYIDGIFAGYGLITRRLETAADTNRYVAGASMALYDAIEINVNGDSGDFGHDGVNVERDRNNNVRSMKVLAGYAGKSVEFINKEGEEASLEGKNGRGTWTYRTVDKGDADILFYPLEGLAVTEHGMNGYLYGYDQDGRKIRIRNRKSIYALKDGLPIYELTGGDLEETEYSLLDKCFTGISPETVIYHIDTSGIRDCQINPTTGMAYVESINTNSKEMGMKKILVWPVNVSRTAGGAVIAREKRKTWRIASINADTKQEYTIGTYEDTGLQERMNPVLNRHGLPEYYQKSEQTYTKGKPVYDIDHDYVRYRFYDLLPAFNKDAYQIHSKKELLDVGEPEDPQDDKALYHRQGEACIMENTWLTGEQYPNDPFKKDMTTGQADVLKRVIPGAYIMEELEAPLGYTKGFPKGVTVRETVTVQNSELEDEKIKIEVAKTDAADQYRINVISDYQERLEATEIKGSYSYRQIMGAHLTIYRAKRVNTTDHVHNPKGYYLQKAEDRPAEWIVENTADNTPVTVVGDWITDGTPKYFEGIPAGDYILEEKRALGGFIRCSMELEVKETGEVQTFQLKDDHTKLEIYKYYRDKNGTMTQLPNDHAASLALYKAQTDQNGDILVSGGRPQYDAGQIISEWTTDDLAEYTTVFENSRKLMDRLKSFLGSTGNTSGFFLDFEKSYHAEGDAFTYLRWYTKDGERNAKRISSSGTGQEESVTQLWRTDEGKTIRITIYRNVTKGSLDKEGQLPLNFEYQFNYRELSGGVKEYDTLEGLHRIDYLPFTDVKDGRNVGNYVLVETKGPNGYKPAVPKAVIISETGAIQRFSLENEERYLDVIKVITAEGMEIPVAGVKLGFYRSDEAGVFVEDEKHLAETWVSGNEGKYTVSDQQNGSIPTGLQIGDWKAHRLKRITDGIYYLIELGVPDYVEKGPEIRLEVNADTGTLYRMVNHPSVGRVEITKKDSISGQPLDGARFKITNLNGGDEWDLVTGDDGKAAADNLPVGVIDGEGVIKPFTYKIEETGPPDYYQSSKTAKKFQFDGISGEKVIPYVCEIGNKPTVIHFNKTSFDSGMAVEGAVLSVCQAREEKGLYVRDGEALAVVTAGKNGFTLTKKLIASHTYMMEEEVAPAGFAKAAPVIFTVNSTGNGICNISTDFSVLKLAYDADAIESLTVIGRIPTDAYRVVRDLDTGVSVPGTFRGGKECILTAKEITDNHLYKITEYTEYSDGNRKISFRETRRLYLDREGNCVLPARTGLKAVEQLADDEGRVIETWTVKGDNHDHTIRNQENRQDTLVKNGSYVLTETTEYSDETVLKSGEYRFSLDESGIINNIEMEDRPVSVSFSKVDLDTGEELGGGGYILLRADTEQIIYEFRKPKGEKMLIPAGLLEPGQEYLLREVTPPKGYAREEEIRFDVNPEGIPETVVMQDKRTEVWLSKIDEETGAKIEGGRFIVKDTGTGETVYEYTAAGARTLVSGILEAGKTYEFIEAVPPPGFYFARSMIFTVPKNPETITIVMKDQATDVIIKKLAVNQQAVATPDQAARLSGCVLQILELDRKPVKAVRDSADFKAGEALILTTAEQQKEIKGQLTAGKQYLLHEVTPASGYAWAEDVPFSVSRDGSADAVIMYDKPTKISVSKTDITGKQELPGNRLSILDLEGDVVERWISQLQPHEITAKLIAGQTYLLHEESPLKGYGYAADISFTVSLDGTVDLVEMKNEITSVRINKVTVTGTPIAGAVLQILDEKKTVLVPSFVTGGSWIDVTGTLEAGKSYYLHEVRAPAGYLRAADIPFTVPRFGGWIPVTMTDLKEPDSTEKTMYLRKTDAENGLGLEGFEFTITGPDHKSFTVVTGNNGNAQFEIPPDGIYTYRETGAGPGYLIPDGVFSFTIKGGGVTAGSTLLVADQKVPHDRDSDDVPRIGKITASYGAKRKGGVKGAFKIQRPEGERTGDFYPVPAVTVIMLFSLTGYLYEVRKKKKKKRKQNQAKDV